MSGYSYSVKDFTFCAGMLLRAFLENEVLTLFPNTVEIAHDAAESGAHRQARVTYY